MNAAAAARKTWEDVVLFVAVCCCCQQKRLTMSRPGRWEYVLHGNPDFYYEFLACSVSSLKISKPNSESYIFHELLRMYVSTLQVSPPLL